MTAGLLVRIFLVAFNAAIPLGIGLFLAATLWKSGGGGKRNASRIPRGILLAAPLLLVLTLKILAPSFSLSLLKVPSRAFQVLPLAPGSDSGNGAMNIPAVATPAISPLWTWAAAFWMIVAVWLVLRMVMNLRAARLIEKEAANVQSDRLLALFMDAAREIGCRCPVALKGSRRISSPISLSLFRASVLLPDGMIFWPHDELRCVLRHELAHIRNRDLVWRLAIRFACSLMWFHPAAWLALRRLASVQERESDRIAVGDGVLPSQYAGILLKTLWRKKNRACSAAAAMNPGCDLKARIRCVLESGRPAPPRSGRKAAAAALVLIAVPAVAFLDVWDIDSVRSRNIEIVRSRSAVRPRGGEEVARRRDRIWLDEETHRWGWE